GDGLALVGFCSCPKPVGAMKETIAMVVTTNKQAVVRSFFIIVSDASDRLYCYSLLKRSLLTVPLLSVNPDNALRWFRVNLNTTNSSLTTVLKASANAGVRRMSCHDIVRKNFGSTNNNKGELVFLKRLQDSTHIDFIDRGGHFTFRARHLAHREISHGVEGEVVSPPILKRRQGNG